MLKEQLHDETDALLDLPHVDWESLTWVGNSALCYIARVHWFRMSLKCGTWKKKARKGLTFLVKGQTQGLQNLVRDG